MKKKFLLVLSIVAVLACLFAITVSAETALKPQDTNAYGELSFFDESISVGRTNAKYGFTPYIDAGSTTYARIVVGDGTTFYTFPTAYALSNSSIWGDDSHGTIYVLDLTSLNTAMEAQTGTNPGWTYKSVYRIEMPYRVTYLNGGNNQAFTQYSNVVEIYLQPNTTTKDSNKQMLLFWNCENLEAIHNLDTFVFKAGVSGGAFQNDAKLTNLTIGVSPDMTTTQDSMFSGCTALQSVNLFEAFPNLTSIGKFTFSGCTALKTVYSANLKQEGAIMIPEGVTSIGQEAFYNCDSVKYLSLPSTITYLGPSIMRDSTGLEFVDFNENANAINLDNWGHFSGCSGLKAVSLPDGIEIINNRFMVSCSNLQAVYLPANLKQMNTNGNGQGPFCFSSKMYFVQEPFEVRDANGYFLGDSFKMPSKPEIYYMPENLATAGGNASSGTWFRDCFALNNTIVMPEAFTESTVAQMFRGIASSSQQKNVVYRGKITNYCWSEMNKYINFVFAHPENTDISTINFTAFYNRNNENCYFYFCSTGFRYTMAKASADEVAATKEENSYCHIHNPKADKTTEATCTLPAGAYTYCFCGVIMTSDIVEGSEPLGHSDIDAAIVYYYKNNNYFETSYKKFTCTREGCGEEIDTQNGIPALFIAKGMTVPDYGVSALCHAIQINLDAVEKYNAFLGEGNEIKYGVLAGVAIDGNKPVGADGKSNCDAIVIGFEATKFSIIQLKLTGLEKANKQLYCGAYVVVDGTVSYLYEGVVSDEATPLTVNNGILDQTTLETTVEETKENA